MLAGGGGCSVSWHRVCNCCQDDLRSLHRHSRVEGLQGRADLYWVQKVGVVFWGVMSRWGAVSLEKLAGPGPGCPQAELPGMCVFPVELQN